MKNFYEILNIKQNSSKDEIKSAFRLLAKRYHPDISKEANAKEKMQEITEAYETLIDEDKRKEYDKTLNMESQTYPFNYNSEEFSNIFYSGFSSVFSSIYKDTTLTKEVLDEFSKYIEDILEEKTKKTTTKGKTKKQNSNISILSELDKIRKDFGLDEDPTLKRKL